jgi:hypothetical protein
MACIGTTLPLPFDTEAFFNLNVLLEIQAVFHHKHDIFVPAVSLIPPTKRDIYEY